MRRVPLLQLARFGAVGVSNTLLSFVVYALALRVGVRYLPAGAGAFAVGGVNGFVLNRSWTFGARGSVLRAGSRYAVVQVIGLLANLTLLRVAVADLGIAHLLAQALAVGPVTLLCFALSRLWVFRANRDDDAPEDPRPDRPGGARARRALRRRPARRPWPALRGRVAAQGRR